MNYEWQAERRYLSMEALAQLMLETMDGVKTALPEALAALPPAGRVALPLPRNNRR